MIQNVGLFIKGIGLMFCIAIGLWIIGLKIAALAFAALPLTYLAQAATGITDGEWSLRALTMCVCIIGILVVTVWLFASDQLFAFVGMLYIGD